MENQLTRHYTPADLGGAIDAGLRTLTGNSRPVTIDDLAPVDEFHIGSRKASVHLFDQLNLSAADRVLDIGAGIGGTARFVAQHYGCSVEGIDLTPEFCQVAKKLNDLVGLSAKVTVHEGSALDMPFEDGSFSAAYMMHVGMNIEDKAALFSEAHRVLKPGASFAVYDVLRGSGTSEFRFPVPWASVSENSYLASPDEMTRLLTDAGFTVGSTVDRTEFAVEFFDAAMAAMAQSGPPPIGLHLILGENARPKLGNMVANIKDGLCGPWEIVARKEG